LSSIGTTEARAAQLARSNGGRTWWAHFECTRINTTPTILRKKIEESLRNKPKTSRVGKCVGYLDLRAFQGERQTGGVIVDIGSPLSTIPIVAE
jgi:hypothetical protein